METWKLTWSNLIGLTIDNINGLDANIEGVYRLSKHEGEKAFVFYVGYGRIREKLLHHVQQEENVCIKTTIETSSPFFKYSIITNEEVARATVRRLFKLYLPPCNAEEPIGREDILVNLE